MFFGQRFFAGFILGFGAGVGFRALAERDFQPIKDMMKTGIGLSNRVGDVFADTVGRIREAYEDFGAEVKADRVDRTRISPRPAQKRAAPRRVAKKRTSASRVLHA